MSLTTPMALVSLRGLCTATPLEASSLILGATLGVLSQKAFGEFFSGNDRSSLVRSFVFYYCFCCWRPSKLPFFCFSFFLSGSRLVYPHSIFFLRFFVFSLTLSLYLRAFRSETAVSYVVLLWCVLSFCFFLFFILFSMSSTSTPSTATSPIGDVLESFGEDKREYLYVSVSKVRVSLFLGMFRIGKTNREMFPMREFSIAMEREKKLRRYKMRGYK